MGKRVLLIPLAIVAATAIVFGGITLARGLGDDASHANSTVTSPANGNSPASANGKGPKSEKDTDFGSVTIYSVTSDGTLDPATDGLSQHVWDTFKRVVTPAFASSVISSYRVGDAPNSDTLAYVYRDTNPEHWVLAANLATSKVDSDLIATLVHEYAHLITLDGTQMGAPDASCATVSLDEGCAVDASYLWKFEQQFWAGYSNAPAAANSDTTVAHDFYLAHEEDFVSDYAATNVVEDTAESFMTFVLQDRPGSDTVVAKKLNFFWEYPQLVTIRERIRTEFRTELGLG